jgi:hypothetical protein
MHKNANSLENLSLGQLTSSVNLDEKNDWSQKSTTLYAHPSGKLPSRFAAVGWQPWHRPGDSNTALVSTTVAGLTRRSQNAIRGEA